MKSMQWQGCSLATRASLLVATGFGLGLSPVASGTAGALIGLALSVVLAPLAAGWQVAAAAALSLAAVPFCTAAERHFGKKDDGRIVADEYLTFPLCTIGLPALPWVLAMAFVTNRAMDVLKPPPARALQGLRGGWGIVIDDVFAAVYSLALNHALYRLVLHLGA
jgi:phosphatidylglycerophosphatase A